ncbi:hypothetical protein PRIPAC_81633, partial [Pristionchus pacificus]|uniref:Uncharacterized protein n=1 Tax=Pristionchus pacificus TaxID=54126 RepID=A0A2A6CQ07_PRIPA
MFNSICPNGTLHLGYAAEYFPYFYEKDNGEFSGIVFSLFRTLSRQFGCNRTEVHKFPKQRMNNSYEVFDGAVDRGEVLTALDTSWLRVTDILFMEKEQKEVLTSDFSFYAVFPIEILALCIVSWIFYCCVGYIHRKMSACQHNVVIATLDLFRMLLIQYSIVIIFVIYQANFNGTTLILSFSATTLPIMLEDLKTGTVVLIGSHSPAMCEEYIDECLRRVCDDTSRVGLSYEDNLYSFHAEKALSSNCQLVEIPLHRGESTGIGWLTERIRNGYSYNYLISRNYSRTVMDAINFHLLSTYNMNNRKSVLRYIEWKYALAAGHSQEKEITMRTLSPTLAISFQK